MLENRGGKHVKYLKTGGKYVNYQLPCIVYITSGETIYHFQGKFMKYRKYIYEVASNQSSRIKIEGSICSRIDVGCSKVFLCVHTGITSKAREMMFRR